jgi:hypothetical protein
MTEFSMATNVPIIRCTSMVINDMEPMYNEIILGCGEQCKKWKQTGLFESFILFQMLPIPINAPTLEFYCTYNRNERNGIIGRKEIVIDAQIL